MYFFKNTTTQITYFCDVFTSDILLFPIHFILHHDNILLLLLTLSYSKHKRIYFMYWFVYIVILGEIMLLQSLGSTMDVRIYVSERCGCVFVLHYSSSNAIPRVCIYHEASGFRHCFSLDAGDKFTRKSNTYVWKHFAKWPTELMNVVLVL